MIQDADIKYHLNTIKDVLILEETEDTWERITKAILSFLGICEQGGYETAPAEVISALRNYCRPIISAMNSERTRLSGAAIDLLVSAATGLGREFEQLLTLFMPPLLALCGRTNKVVISRARTCIITIIESTQLASILPYFLQNIKEKSTSLRLVVAEGTLACLNSCNPPDLEKESRARDIEGVIRGTARDANADVRKLSRKIFECYKILLPGRVDSFTAPLTPTMKKYLDIKTNGVSSQQSTSNLGANLNMKPNVKPSTLTSASTSTMARNPGHSRTASTVAASTATQLRNLTTSLTRVGRKEPITAAPTLYIPVRSVPTSRTTSDSQTERAKNLTATRPGSAQEVKAPVPPLRSQASVMSNATTSAALLRFPMASGANPTPAASGSQSLASSGPRRVLMPPPPPPPVPAKEKSAPPPAAPAKGKSAPLPAAPTNGKSAPPPAALAKGKSAPPSAAPAKEKFAPPSAVPAKEKSVPLAVPSKEKSASKAAPAKKKSAANLKRPTSRADTAPSPDQHPGVSVVPAKKPVVTIASSLRDRGPTTTKTSIQPKVNKSANTKPLVVNSKTPWGRSAPVPKAAAIASQQTAVLPAISQEPENPLAQNDDGDEIPSSRRSPMPINNGDKQQDVQEQEARVHEQEAKVQEQEVNAQEQEATAQEQETNAQEQEANVQEQEANAQEQEANAQEREANVQGQEANMQEHAKAQEQKPLTSPISSETMTDRTLVQERADPGEPENHSNSSPITDEAPTTPQGVMYNPPTTDAAIFTGKTPISALLSSIQRGFLYSPSSPLSPADSYLLPGPRGTTAKKDRDAPVQPFNFALHPPSNHTFGKAIEKMALGDIGAVKVTD